MPEQTNERPDHGTSSADFGIDPSALACARAADDLRRGLPVVLRADGSAILVGALETLSPAALEVLMARDGAECLITAHRAASLHVPGHGKGTVALQLTPWMSAEDLRGLGDPTLDLANPMKGPFQPVRRTERGTDSAAIALLKAARLLPAAIVAPVNLGDSGLIEVGTSDIADVPDELVVTARAKVPLEGAEDVTLIAFRPVSGGLEHFALVIGDPAPGSPVLARLHSECFTGDLLGSLKCDCGEQLKGAVSAIRAAGGGIVLYLAQEGRGIGLVPKLKAYALQDQGFDTVDANTRLGFEVDERLFAPAANMLKTLGFTAVRLMTNNPAKVEGLSSCGITVSERIAHAFPTNRHNEQYLGVKRDRTGHLL